MVCRWRPTAGWRCLPVGGPRAEPVNASCGRWPERPGASVSVTRACYVLYKSTPLPLPLFTESEQEIVAYRLRGEGLVWMIGALVYLSYCTTELFAIVGNRWPHNVPWYHQLMPISCHFQTVKHCWSQVYSCNQRYSKYPDLYVYLHKCQCKV